MRSGDERSVSLRAFFICSPFLLVTRIKWLRIEIKVKLNILKIWDENRLKDFNDDNIKIAKFLLPFEIHPQRSFSGNRVGPSVSTEYL